MPGVALDAVEGGVHDLLGPSRVWMKCPPAYSSIPVRSFAWFGPRVVDNSSFRLDGLKGVVAVLR